MATKTKSISIVNKNNLDTKGLDYDMASRFGVTIEEIENGYEHGIIDMYDNNGDALNGTTCEVLYFPSIGRASIVWGAYPDWTDCDSIEDAAERYFEINGKEMAE